MNTKRGAEQQELFRILDSIVTWAHWVYGISKVVLKFVKVYLAKTNPKLSKIRQALRVMDPKHRFFRGADYR